MGPPPLLRLRPSARAGFTLIELLIVVVIVGILAAMAARGFDFHRQRAYDGAVKTDLRNAMAAEEAYYSDYGTYASFSVTSGGSNADPEFTASANVSVTATASGSGGVRIEGSHAASSKAWCISTTSTRVVEGSGC
jgi:prepilin-type N-terminal cleavage/methylation domain-containing protein